MFFSFGKVLFESICFSHTIFFAITFEALEPLNNHRFLIIVLNFSQYATIVRKRRIYLVAEGTLTLRTFLFFKTNLLFLVFSIESSLLPQYWFHDP